MPRWPGLREAPRRRHGGDGDPEGRGAAAGGLVTAGQLAFNLPGLRAHSGAAGAGQLAAGPVGALARPGQPPVRCRGVGAGSRVPAGGRRGERVDRVGGRDRDRAGAPVRLACKEVVELGRLCADPAQRWATRPMLRLWREVAARRWPYWTPAARSPIRRTGVTRATSTVGTAGRGFLTTAGRVAGA